MPQPPQSIHGLPDNLESAHEQILELRQEAERHRQRAEASERDTRCFRELAEHIREVFWMTNPLGDRLIYISPAYEQIWGQTCHSLYEDPGRRLAWVHDHDRERVLKAFLRDAAQGDYDETFRITRPDGEIRWIRDRAFPVRDAHGDIYRLAGFALDLTDKIENHDRVSELQNLIAMRERISVFASLGTGLAHDLGQPLTSARNFIAHALTQAQQGNTDNAELMARAQYQVERAGTIVRHLRDFAREGRPTISREPLQPVLNEVFDLLEPTFRAEQVAYTWPQNDNLGSLELPMDRIFTQQVLRNLISNAIEALAASSIPAQERHITLRIDADNIEHIDIQISDNGDGIGDDIDLFTPFMTTKRNGLGLGLSVSRSLARSHGGDLVVLCRGPRAGGPTTFLLRLPRRLDNG